MPYHIVTVTKNALNPAYIGARGGIDRLARQLGVTVEHLIPEVPDSVSEQAELLGRLANDRPDAVILAPADATELDSALDKLHAAGIPVFQIVGRTTKENYVSFVGSDEYAMTLEVARKVCETLGGRGEIAVIDNHPLGTNYYPRSRGFRDAIDEYPEILLVAARTGFSLRGPARVAAAGILEEHPGLDAILTANDFMMLGVKDAMCEQGIDLPVGSVNATPDAVRALLSGDLVVSAAFNAMAMGCLALEAAVRHLRGQAVPKEILVPAELVTRENAAAWDLPYEERPLPSWQAVVGHKPA